MRNCIRENRIFEIPNIIETSRALGMQTLDSSIKQLYVNGFISTSDAVAQAAHPEKLGEISSPRKRVESRAVLSSGPGSRTARLSLKSRTCR